MLRIAATWLVLSAAAVLLVGCGGGGQNSAETHLAALAKTYCREVKGLSERVESPGYNGATLKVALAKLRAQRATVRALIHSDRKLPRVATLISDQAAAQKAQAARREASHPLMDEYRLDVKVYADEKALGIACIGRPPRKPIAG